MGSASDSESKRQQSPKLQSPLSDTEDDSHKDLVSKVELDFEEEKQKGNEKKIAVTDEPKQPSETHTTSKTDSPTQETTDQTTTTTTTTTAPEEQRG